MITFSIFQDRFTACDENAALLFEIYPADAENQEKLVELVVALTNLIDGRGDDTAIDFEEA